MASPSIAAGAVRALIDFALSKGAERDALMRLAGLDEAQLADPDSRLPFDRYVAVMRAAKSVTGDAALALRFGEALDLADLSIVGLIAQASDTMGDAFRNLDGFDRLLVDVELQEHANGKRYVLSRTGAGLWFVDLRKDPNAFPELTESSIARMVCTARRLFDRRIVKAVHVTHRAPAHRDEYDRILQVPVVFESDRNALLLTDDAWMADRPAAPSPYVLRVLKERAEGLLKTLDSAGSMRARVELMLEPALHSGPASMASVAKTLGVSRATLFRRLKAEGATFEDVLGELRHRLAVRYLAAERRSVAEAARLLGFSDATAFSRAFRRRTGTSPRDFRKSQVGDGGAPP